MNVFGNTPTLFTASIFGEGNALLGTTVFNVGSGATFFGVSDVVPIGRINFSSAISSGEIIDHVAFGAPDNGPGLGHGPAPVLEPSTMVLLGTGLIGLIGYQMRKPQA